MPDYKEMYLTLFRAVTLATQILEDRKNIPQTLVVLKTAQLKCEDIYIETSEQNPA